MTTIEQALEHLISRSNIEEWQMDDYDICYSISTRGTSIIIEADDASFVFTLTSQEP